jgi:primase-polymerase (primpol)-like protein
MGTEDRDGKPTKVPVDPATGGYASVSEAGTWTDYATARAYAQATDEVDGIGFVFTADDPYAGVDLDDCRNPDSGAIEDWAVAVLRQLDSYTEYSPSGTGFHVIVEGDVPSGGNRTEQLELYSSQRYFTVTGNRVPGAPTEVKEHGDALRAVHEEYIASGAAESDANVAPPTEPVSVSDEALLEKAMNAANGAKFQRLWDGDTSRYESHSEADQALCTLLAFWTGGDADRIERLFARSELVRAKWRERADYRERTIRNAIRHCSAFYDPSEDA